MSSLALVLYVEGSEIKAEWFGAVPDWDGSTGTDNAPIVNAAIQYARDNRDKHNTVTCGVGRFSLGSPLKIKQSISFVGAGLLGGTAGGTEFICNFPLAVINNPPTDLYQDGNSLTRNEHFGGTIVLEKTPVIYNTELMTQQTIKGFRFNCNNQDVYGGYFTERYSSVLDQVAIPFCPNAWLTLVYNQACNDGFVAGNVSGGAYRLINCTTCSTELLNIEGNNSKGAVLDMVHQNNTKGSNIIKQIHYEETSTLYPTGAAWAHISGTGQQIESGHFTINSAADQLTRNIQLMGVGDTFSYDGVMMTLAKSSGTEIRDLHFSLSAGMGFELRENVSSAIISTNITPKNSWDNSGRTDNYIESNAGGGARFGRDFQVLTQARKKMLHFMDDNTVNFFDNNNRKLVANGANATLYNLSGNLGLSASQTLQLFGGSVIDVNANGQNFC